MRYFIWFFTLILFLSNETFSQVLGRVEKVKLVSENTILKAKLDTGAKMSSLDARQIHIYKKNNQMFVSFKLKLPHQQKELSLNYPILSSVKIKKHAHKVSTRPVIRLRVCLGTTIKTITVNLTDRDRFLYPLLLGRDSIRDFSGTIDPNKHFTVDPHCDEQNTHTR